MSAIRPLTLGDSPSDGQGERFTVWNPSSWPFSGLVAVEGAAFDSAWFDAEGHELAPGERGNVLQVFEDEPRMFDAWDIDIYYQEKMRELSELVFVSVQSGPLRSVVAFPIRPGDGGDLRHPVRQREAADALEHELGSSPVRVGRASVGRLEFELLPYEIKTFRIELN